MAWFIFHNMVCEKAISIELVGVPGVFLEVLQFLPTY